MQTPAEAVSCQLGHPRTDAGEYCQMAQIFARPGFSKGQVNRAGELLRQTDQSELFYPVDWDDALQVINNWRSCHGFPLQIVKMTLLKRSHSVARASRSKALVVQRLKRLESIWTKLRSQKNMELTQMQDIGGCRSVLRSMNQVREVAAMYEKSIARGSDRGPEFKERYDYIDDRPKPSGYRSLHYVYRYRAVQDQHKCYDGLRIEIQIRSQLQHAWATAVETVSVVTKQALKSNVGTDDWKRFFALMGSAIALRERTKLIPDTPTNKRELFNELKDYAKKLNVDDVLSGYGVGVYEIAGQEKGAEVFLLVLDPVKQIVDVTPFGKNQLLEAEDAYLDAEKKLERDKGMQAVLVSAESVRSLMRAYPNYFLDTRAFLTALRMAISK